jgi:hypothetical protein
MLRACGRWGVWLCAGLMVVGVVSSFVIQPGVAIEHLDLSTREVTVFDSIDIKKGQMIVRHYKPIYPQPLSSTLENYDVDIRFRSKHYLNRPVSWWRIKPRRMGDPSFATLWDFSIVYPTLLMLGWSLWLVQGQRKLRRGIGYCTGCGYSLVGLNSCVCPECGERVGGDAHA